MTLTPLKAEEQVSKGGATHCLEITYADLTDADASQTLTPITVANGTAFMVTQAQLVEAFVSSDATLTSTTLKVGDGGDTSRFLASMELNSAGTEVFVKGGALTAIYQYTAADTVDALIECTAGKLLNSHTAGKVRVYGLFAPLPGTP